MANKTKKTATQQKKNTPVKPATEQASPKNEQKKAPEKKPTTPPKKAPAAPPKTEEKPEVKPAVAGVSQQVVSAATGSLDANRRMDMLTNMRVMFHEDPRARQNLGDDIVDTIDDLTRAGLICALADQAVNGDDTFSAVLKSQDYPALILAAHKMGIKLPALKALPVNDDGSVVVNSNDIEVAESVAEELKEEKKVEDAGDAGDIELDPVKIAEMGEEALIKALKYYMISGPKKSSPFDMLTAIVDFMKEYRNALAEKAENAEEAKGKYTGYTTYDWLMDAFSFVSPTMLFKGIGGGMRDLVIIEKSPLSAFVILRKAFYAKKTECPWTDQDLADATRAIIEFICNTEIKSSEALITTLVEDDENYQKEKDRLEGIIAVHKDVLNSIQDISFDIVESIASESNKTERTAKGRIWNMYYPECDASELPRYKNLIDNIAMRAGIILNLFRDPNSRNLNYSEANITPVEKYTMEEYNEILKSKKEAEKKDSKND